jgi:hypothetical protein
MQSSSHAELFSQMSAGRIFTTKRGVYASPRLFSPTPNARLVNGSPMPGRQAGRPFVMRHGIPIFRGQTRISFRRR